MAQNINSFFPDINEIARAREQFAQTARANQLQPGRVEAQGLVNKGAGQQNTLRDFKIQSEERNVASINQLGQLKGGLAAATTPEAESEARRTFAREQPEQFQKVLKAEADQRKATKEEYETGVIAIARGATSILRMAADGASPEEIQKAHTIFRENTLRRNPKMRPDDIPEKFSAVFAKASIDLGTSIAELRKSAGLGENALTTVGVPGKPGAEQPALVNKFTGTRKNVGPPLEPAPSAAGGRGGGSGLAPGEIKAADTNALRGIIKDLTGDFFDPRTGEIRVLNPDLKRLAQAVLDEASKIFVQGGITHGEAVTKAADRLGVKIIVPPKLGPDGRPVAGPPSKKRDKQLRDMEDFVNNS